MVEVLEQDKKIKTFLLFLFLFSFLIRALSFNFFLKNKDLLSYDSAVYNDVALQIAQGNGISEKDGSAHFYRVPGYSTFLALGYKFFSKDIKKILWIQIFFAALIPLLIFCLSFVLFPQDIFLAKISSIISSFHLGFVIFSCTVMAEVLFVVFFLLFLILFLSEFEFFFSGKMLRFSLGKFFLAGILLGMASLIRPVGHYLISLSMLLLFFSNLTFIQKTKTNFFLFLGWFLIVFWWLLRNFLLTGYIFFHTLPGVHFLKHSAARIKMETEKCTYMQALTKINHELEISIKDTEKKVERKINGIEFCLLAENISYNYFKKYWFVTLKHFFSNMFKTCFSLYSAELLFFDSGGSLPSYDQERNIFLRFICPRVSNRALSLIIYLEILFVLLLWAGFIGFVFSSFFNEQNLFVAMKVLPFIILFIAISLACGFARLRLPIEPFLIILSFGFWIDLCWRKKRILWKISELQKV